MDRRESERILEVISEVRAAGTRAAIATVVRVKGSAYRREGARIIVREDGTHECLLSGGCLEPTVAAAAARVIATGEPVIASYDLEEDSLLGLGIGCSGAVDIRIERVEDDPVTRAWLQVLERAEAAVLVTPLAGSTGRLVVSPNGAVVGDLSNPELVPRAIARAHARMAASFPASGTEQVGEAELFFELSEAPPKLVIFGAGPDAGPLANLAGDAGFAVTVVDVREAFLTAERFPRATLVSAHFSHFPERLRLDAQTHVVVMNHHLERDQESLGFALASDAPYIGLLGPRSRYQKLLSGLRKQGYAPGDATLSRVRSPIGLSLGAESPEEIAVSILGELLAFRRGFDGGFLNGRESSLHRPDAIRSIAR
ncbi:MAG TPA: XdhC family protein [Vicinamibacterales bacterium]|jgi:xanthine dehydrogenase accessory factor|nr:XdhC family protein [Vicinamibacterales bacterium]